ncbi:uncharacterized protein LOC135503395 [Lineus longissimus]|uniref:uncharacterized protein LOC135503395 n=1 Tax=Lineus longissimus TaxID=88925 RepID=UPI00315CC5E4
MKRKASDSSEEVAGITEKMSKRIAMEPKKTELSAIERLKRAQGIQPSWQAMCDQEVLHYVQALANSIGCPEEHFFFPLLSITAALVSTNASVHITESWNEPAVLWFAVLAKQGEMKAPSMNILLKALADVERRNNDLNTSEDIAEGADASLVLDEVNYNQSTLRNTLAQHRNRLLLIAKDLSFLCKQTFDKNPADLKDRERRHVLSSVYNGNDPNFSAAIDSPMCFNVTGFFNPKRVLGMMTVDDIDPILSHIMFSCPLERDCFMEDLNPMPSYLPPLSLLFHIISHSNQYPTKYQFNADALIVVNEYLNDLIMQKRAVPNDETKRYIFTKARAQFCRLALICHILRDAMQEAIARFEKNSENGQSEEELYAVNNDWKSSVISIDAVQQAREIMVYFIDQKLGLLPGSTESVQRPEPEVPREQPKQMAPVSVPYKQHAQQSQWANHQNPKAPSPAMPAMNVLQEMHNSAREFLSHMTSSRDLQNHFRAQQAVHTPQSRRSPAFPSPMHPMMQHMNGYAQTKAALAAPSLVTALPTSSHSSHSMVPMPYQMSPSPVSSAPINMVKNENDSPLALTSKPRSNGTANRSSGHHRKNPNPHPAHARSSPNFQGAVIPPNMIKMCGRTPTIVGTEGENGTYHYDFSNLLPYASKNLRSLLTSGHKEISASIVAGRHLMPPTKTPGTENRYKTEAAVAYLQKVADLGFGTIYRTNKKSTVFRKRPYEELESENLDILEKIQVTESAYKRIKTAMSDGDRPRRREKLPISMAPINSHMAFMNSLNLAASQAHNNNNNNISPLLLKEELQIKEEDVSMLGGDLSMDIDTSSEHSTSISNPPSVASTQSNVVSQPPHLASSPPNIASSPPNTANIPSSHHFTMTPLNLKRESPLAPEIQAST